MSDRPPDAGFTPIRPNPYIVGNPIRERAMFFGREAEFELVRTRFHDSRHGMLVVFCGERRSGKTSILFQIVDRRLGPDYIPVLIDMQAMAVENDVEFLARIAEEVQAALGRDEHGPAIAPFQPDSNPAGTFRRFIQDVVRANPGKKLVLLFDEYELFENKIESGQLAQEVLRTLANLMENQPVFLIFTGSQHVEQRRPEYWNVLVKASVHKRISFLDREDALNLVCRPVESRAQFEEGTVEAILRLTAGQPFYTQAICQSLVDHLNDKRTNLATPRLVGDVVKSIVNNPLPQMIFMWEGLDQDEKLVLSLLAECLESETALAEVDDIVRLVRDRQYPAVLDRPRIATTLAKLFQAEMLERDDHRTPPGYAFRMDLWRLWIRRQHSAWQVIRELGLRTRPSSPVLRWALGAGVAVAALALAWRLMAPRHDQQGASSRSTVGAAAFLRIEPVPSTASVHVDDRLMGVGIYSDSITSSQDHTIRLSAPGFADSSLHVRLAPGEVAHQRVVLRELLGDLRIETRPPGAAVSIDGVARGVSPLLVRGLTVVQTHRVEATLAGYGAVLRDATVRPGQAADLIIPLETGKADLQITTVPPSSQIRLDGSTIGPSPQRVTLTFGKHRVSASHEGYLDADTSLVVTADTRQIDLALGSEPLGILVVEGDRAVNEIWIDGRFVIGSVQTSGERPLRRGTYSVRVVPRSGEPIDTVATVLPRETTVFDYSERTVIRRPSGGRRP